MYTKENFYEMDKTDLQTVSGGSGDRFLGLENLMPGIGIGPPEMIVRPPVTIVPLYGIPQIRK